MSEFQQTILQKVGLAKAKPDPAPNTQKSDAPVKPTAAKKGVAQKPPAAKPVKAAANLLLKAPSGKKPAAGKASEPKAPKKNASSPGLTKLAGVGPATAKQMKEAGILSLTQGNPLPQIKSFSLNFPVLKEAKAGKNKPKALVNQILRSPGEISPGISPVSLSSYYQTHSLPRFRNINGLLINQTTNDNLVTEMKLS